MSELFWRDMGAFQESPLNDISVHLDSKNRASSIFPIFKLPGSSATISFLAYWVKKHGNSVAIKLTARDLDGVVKDSSWFPVTELLTYDISIDRFPFLSELSDGFCGSVEVEVFSSLPPAFTFPAITLQYYNENGSSSVHSCMRGYNIDETPNDYAINYPQTGFDVVFSEQTQNYICFFGGQKKVYNIRLTLDNDRHKQSKHIEVKNQNYGQTHILYIENYFSKEDCDGVAKVSIDHNIDLFPRLYTGVIRKGFVPSLTHTFFDTSSVAFSPPHVLASEIRAQNRKSDSFYDGAFMVPVLSVDEFDTSIRSYGQNLHFDGRIEQKIFSENGELIGERILTEDEVSSLNEFSTIDLSKEIRKMGLHDAGKLTAFFGFSGGKFGMPTRFKLGLNVKRIGEDVGSNICFAPVVQKSDTISKPFTRRWFPIGGPQKFVSSLHILNFERYSNGTDIDVNLEFVNSEGDRLTKSFSKAVGSTVFFDIQVDDELDQFLSGELGWCFATVSSYVADAFYISTHGSQVGGDHAF